MVTWWLNCPFKILWKITQVTFLLNWTRYLVIENFGTFFFSAKVERGAWSQAGSAGRKTWLYPQYCGFMLGAGESRCGRCHIGGQSGTLHINVQTDYIVLLDNFTGLKRQKQANKKKMWCIYNGTEQCWGFVFIFVRLTAWSNFSWLTVFHT